MTSKTPIYSIAKDLNIDSNKIILACQLIGIPAKGATKRLNEEELEKVKRHFESGKNVSQEIVEINKRITPIKSKKTNIKKETKTNYFPNRLIGKS